MSGFPAPQWLYPVTEDFFIYFVAHCYHVLKLQHSTIQTYFAGIRFTYIEQGFTSPLTTPEGLPFIRLQMVLKAVKKLQATPSKPRYPIDASLLKQISRALFSGIFGPFLDTLMRAVCTVAFFGFLRCGEFTASTSKFDPQDNLCLGDVTFNTEGTKLLLHLKRSKTDIFRKGVCIPLYKTYSDICPVTAMQRYLALRQRCGFATSDPLFVTTDGVILTRAKFIQMLRDVLCRLGYDQSGFCGHSFRIGAATTASKANIQDHLIKCLGRWSSNCHIRYIRTPECAIRSAQCALDKQ